MKPKTRFRYYELVNVAPWEERWERVAARARAAIAAARGET